jgi:hypothetical protein
MRKNQQSILIIKGWPILVFMGWMKVLETLLDVKLALVHSEVDRVNLPLHRTHTSLKRR